MAFMGLFLVGIAALFFFLVILGIFIPCLIISIVNLVKGIKNHWPKRNIIALAITGSIVTLFVVAFVVVCIQSAFAGTPANGSGASSSAVTALRFLLKL